MPHHTAQGTGARMTPRRELRRARFAARNATWAARYRAGVGAAQLAQEAGLSLSTVCKALANAGVTPDERKAHWGQGRVSKPRPVTPKPRRPSRKGSTLHSVQERREPGVYCPRCEIRLDSCGLENGPAAWDDSGLCWLCQADLRGKPVWYTGALGDVAALIRLGGDVVTIERGLPVLLGAAAWG